MHRATQDPLWRVNICVHAERTVTDRVACAAASPGIRGALRWLPEPLHATSRGSGIRSIQLPLCLMNMMIILRSNVIVPDTVSSDAIWTTQSTLVGYSV